MSEMTVSSLSIYPPRNILQTQKLTLSFFLHMIIRLKEVRNNKKLYNIFGIYNISEQNEWEIVQKILSALFALFSLGDRLMKNQNFDG